MAREAVRRNQLVQKDLYKHALKGELKGDVPGISAPYEEPENPEVFIASDLLSPHESAKRIMAYVKSRWTGGESVEEGRWKKSKLLSGEALYFRT